MEQTKLALTVENAFTKTCDPNADEIDAWTFIRTVAKPSESLTICTCGEKICDNNASSETNHQCYEANETALENIEQNDKASGSPVFSWISRRRNHRNTTTADSTQTSTKTTITKTNEEEEEEECPVKGCFIHSKPTSPQDISKSNPSLGASSSHSINAQPPPKWKSSLKFQAFRNTRQDTFHSLDMYSKKGNVVTSALPTSHSAGDSNETLSVFENSMQNRQPFSSKNSITKSRASKYSVTDLTAQKNDSKSNLSDEPT